MFVTDGEIGIPPPPRASIPAFLRTDSLLRASFGSRGGRTAALRVREGGALRLRFPRVGGGCEGIILNTSGGIAGGDRQSLDFDLAAGTRVALTTQSAEKVYRSDGDVARIDARFTVADDADLAWLPQDTILFDGARLDRRIDIDLHRSSRLTLREGVVFGRAAMGEAMTHGRFDDRWRLRRDGRLILAEAVRIEGCVAAMLARPASGAGARAIATVVHVAPDAGARLDEIRASLARHPVDAGASAWNGMLIARFAGIEPHHVRAATAAALSILLPDVTPRIWSC